MRTRISRAGERVRPDTDVPDRPPCGGQDRNDPGHRTDLDPDGEAAFREYVTARGATLLRVALLLTSTADPGPHGGYATQSNRARTTT